MIVLYLGFYHFDPLFNLIIMAYDKYDILVRLNYKLIIIINCN